MEKTTIPSEQNFSLAKAKITKDGGLEVKYQVLETSGNEVYSNEYNVVSNKVVHPDLKKLFASLCEHVARVFRQDVVLNIVNDRDFKATAKQKEIAEKRYEELMQNIKPRSISISGKDDNKGVVITSQLVTESGMETCINTPRIRFDELTFGNEVEIEGIIEDIENEVYEYLFKDKKAQLELFGEGAKNE